MIASPKQNAPTKVVSATETRVAAITGGNASRLMRTMLEPKRPSSTARALAMAIRSSVGGESRSKLPRLGAGRISSRVRAIAKTW